MRLFFEQKSYVKCDQRHIRGKHCMVPKQKSAKTLQFNTNLTPRQYIMMEAYAEHHIYARQVCHFRVRGSEISSSLLLFLNTPGLCGHLIRWSGLANITSLPELKYLKCGELQVSFLPLRACSVVVLPNHRRLLPLPPLLKTPSTSFHPQRGEDQCWILQPD